MGLERWPLICLMTALLAATCSHGVELKDELGLELDSLLCPASKELKGKIIDVHKSLELGAKLLDGSWTASLEQCASECCSRSGCDLALYKNDGVSQSGKNCYYIKCESMDNCVMVEHGGFTSVVFQAEKNTNLPGDNPTHIRVNTGDEETDRTGHDPVPSANVPPTSSKEAPPTTPPPKSAVNKGNDVQSVPSQSDSHSTESGQASSEAPPTTLTATSTDKPVEIDGKSVEVEIKGHAGVNGGGIDECGRNGCDGSGVIAIAVVASICFIVIVLVVAVLLRKVVTDNRRRRFKNVDYLINGMYT